MRRLHRYSRSGGACRNVNQGIDSPGNQVLNLADLRRGVALRIHSDDLDSFCLGLTLDRLFDLIEKIRLEIGDGQADGYFGFSSAKAVEEKLA